MTRYLLGIGLALYVALTTGEAPVLTAGSCIEDCADDDADGRCASTCNDCSCCSHVRSIAVPQTAKAYVSLVTSSAPERVQATPPSPEPREILHVPIA